MSLGVIEMLLPFFLFPVAPPFMHRCHGPLLCTTTKDDEGHGRDARAQP